MFVSKSTRNNFVDFLEKYCTMSSISNKSLGILIRSFHISSPIVIIIIVSCTSKIYALINVIILLIIVLLYIIFNGCVLSILEERLCKDSFLLVDPFIEFANMEVNYKNRKTFTAWIMGPIVLIVLLIYYFRFIQ